MEPLKLMVVRYPFGRCEDPDVGDWLISTVIRAREDTRIREVTNFRIDNTPITMGRNKTLNVAQRDKVDFLLMVDSDMSPDAYLASNSYKLGIDPEAKPFFETALDFLWAQRRLGKPSVIAAPYCGPPPHENVYIFRWDTWESDRPHDEANYRLEQYSRYEAAQKRGIERVAALPTGLMMMDMDCLESLSQPYTYYEWADDREDEKASTEDVTFTRDLALKGVPLYCAWDCWAGHWKRKCVGKPHIMTSEQLSDKFRKIIIRDHEAGNEVNGHGKEEEVAGTGGPRSLDHGGDHGPDPHRDLKGTAS